VKRWLDKLPGSDAAIWIELIPFHETRDYIPRVLSFATIYDWRLQQPVQRISSRLRAREPVSANALAASRSYAEIGCAGPATALAAGN
jgi:soluble lytic murein transglycosylase